MEVLIELLPGFFGELVLPLIWEIFRSGAAIAGGPFRKEPSPWVAALGYSVFGAALGGLSLLVLPRATCWQSRPAGGQCGTVTGGGGRIWHGGCRGLGPGVASVCYASTGLPTAMCLRWRLG